MRENEGDLNFYRTEDLLGIDYWIGTTEDGEILFGAYNDQWYVTRESALALVRMILAFLADTAHISPNPEEG